MQWLNTRPMDLKTLAFEAATTPTTTPDGTLCGLSHLHVACIQRDVSTVRTVLMLSPSALDTAIALAVPVSPKHKSHLTGKTTIELLKELECDELANVEKIINKVLSNFLLEPVIHAAVRRGSLRQVRRLIELGADVNILSLNVCCKPAFPIRVPHTDTRFVLCSHYEHMCAANPQPIPNSTTLDEHNVGEGPLVFFNSGSNSRTSSPSAPLEKLKLEAGSISRLGSSTYSQFEEESDYRIAIFTERVLHDGIAEEPSRLVLLQVTTRLVESNLGLSWFKLLFRKMSPLHVATERQELQIMKLLIDNGADVNIQDEYGMTPLHLAARDGWVDGLRCLLLHGADVGTMTGDLPHHARYSCVTALHLAAVCEQPDALTVLIECGAALDAVDGEGATPFHWACKGSRKNNAKLFIEQGCNANGMGGRMNGTAVFSY